MWFWMYTLLALFGLSFIFRLFQYNIRTMRVRAIKTKVTYMPDTKGIFKQELAQLINQIDIADWFVLKNVCIHKVVY